MIELAEIEAARERLAGVAVRTPLVRLYYESSPAEIYLKLESLQPINSFKIRGATNAVRIAPESERAKGLVTASAGNMAQGVAWAARELGLTATIAVPEHAPEAKLDAIERLGGKVVKLPLRGLVERDRHQPARRRRRAVRPSRSGRGRDGRQRHDRARDPRGPARPRRDRDPLRRRRADRRNRQRDPSAPASDQDLHRRAGDRRGAGRGAEGRRAHRGALRAVVCRRLGQPAGARFDVAEGDAAGRRRVLGADRRRAPPRSG